MYINDQNDITWVKFKFSYLLRTHVPFYVIGSWSKTVEANIVSVKKIMKNCFSRSLNLSLHTDITKTIAGNNFLVAYTFVNHK